MQTKLLNAAILIGMGINGALYLAWFRSSDPDRIGYWYLIYFLIFPFLALLGILALALKKPFNLSRWLGLTLLLYVGTLTLLLTSISLGFGKILDMLPPHSFEGLHVIAWGVAVIGLILTMLKR